MATLVNRLNQLEADVIALDFIMPEPDRTSAEVINLERKRDSGMQVDSRLFIQHDINSLQLAESLSKANTVLGYYFSFSGGLPISPILPKGLVVSSSPKVNSSWPRPAGALRSIETVTQAASAEGFTNAQHDIDGVLRRVPLILPYQGRFFPSLAFAAVLQSGPERNVKILNDGPETALFWNNRLIPLDQSGNMMVDFRKEGNAYSYLSARDILSRTPLPVDLRGKIVLVGAMAQGLGDQHQIPGGRAISGLQVHANVIENIFSANFISRPNWSRGAELFCTILLGLLTTWLFCKAGFITSLLTVISATAAAYLGSRHLLVSEGIYISPLMPITVLLLVMSSLSLVKYGIEARKVAQRNRDLIEAQDAIIIGMSTLAEARDEETGAHILRTRHYVEILARQLACTNKYRHLDSNSIDLLAKSAPLHDIGKVGIPDQILHKPTPLTEEEYEVMKTHTLIGAEALARAIRGTEHPENLDFLSYARQMIESHHERWDGRGYPHGLSGNDIPLAGRLMALADVYDALVSMRVYKRDFSHEDAKEIILSEAGRHFDPDVIAAFEARSEEFQQIARAFAD
jgi:HD-GYP domain-containing protein (c-di-GMP phosphodiesterase class II)